eukprot:TRINITY_DN1593_c1_g1_i1.p1 TRINITY_DN1593_c1_g1~~TRINITY_DN1593_c1_g1_i1.p1  ORF type:complete len:334 (+),score=47.81 TRINITY_DN1593_c1_g1_i1:39-1040(+)
MSYFVEWLIIFLASFAYTDAIRIQLRPQFENSTKEQSELVWQLPKARPIDGLLLLFHGCSHSAIDFFQQPEDRYILKQALKARLGVVAFSALDSCWSETWPVHENRDVIHVQRAVRSFMQNHAHSFGKLPLFGFGASSGGSFVSILARSGALGFTGVIIQISPGNSLAFRESTSPSLASFPPTAFIYMKGDLHWASASNINAIAARLKSNHVPVRVYSCSSHPLNPNYFFRRMDADLFTGMSESVSERLVDFIRRSNFLSNDLYLQDDPRDSDIISLLRSHLQSLLPALSSHSIEQLWLPAFFEMLNVAFGRHELTSQHFVSALKFIRQDEVG